jgi:hypothetical protein
MTQARALSVADEAHAAEAISAEFPPFQSASVVHTKVEQHSSDDECRCLPFTWVCHACTGYDSLFPANSPY